NLLNNRSVKYNTPQSASSDARENPFQSSKVLCPASRLRNARVSLKNDDDAFALARRLFFRLTVFDFAARRVFFAERRAGLRAAFFRFLAMLPSSGFAPMLPV